MQKQPPERCLTCSYVAAIWIPLKNHNHDMVGNNLQVCLGCVHALLNTDIQSNTFHVSDEFTIKLTNPMHSIHAIHLNLPLSSSLGLCPRHPHEDWMQAHVPLAWNGFPIDGQVGEALQDHMRQYRTIQQGYKQTQPRKPPTIDENVLSTHSRLAGLIDFLEQTSTDSIGASSGSWGGYSRCRTISESSEQSEPFRSEDVPGRALALSSRLEMGERSTSVSGGLSVKNCLCLLGFFFS